MDIFLTKDPQMANEPMKRCFPYAVLREMQINVTIRCHHTLVRVAKM